MPDTKRSLDYFLNVSTGAFKDANDITAQQLRDFVKSAYPDEYINVLNYGADPTYATSSTSAFNTALQDAFDSQIPLYIPDGHYKIDGSTWGPNNSLLDIVAATGYTAMVPKLRIIGQSRGVINISDNSYGGGVVLDASEATGAAGTVPCVFAASPWVQITGGAALNTAQWRKACVEISEVTILCPSNSTFGALNFGNIMQARVSRCAVLTKTVTGNWVAATNTSWGIIFPQCLNNIEVLCHDTIAVGFYEGIYATEHLRFDGAYVGVCKNGVRFLYGGHPVTGHARIERCEIPIVVDNSATLCTADLTLEIETGALAGDPYTNSIGLYDLNNDLLGEIRYQNLDLDDGLYKDLVLTGGTSVFLKNLYTAKVFSSVSLVTPALGTPVSGTLTSCTGLPDGGLTLTDVTTNNTSTSKHGFAPKLSNVSTEYLSGTGVFSTPAGGSGDFLSVLTAAEIAISNTATTLTIGRMHAITETAADRTMTLPAIAGNTGKFIGIRITRTTTKLVTIDGSGAETIDNAASRVMWAEESAILMCNGSEWVKAYGKSIPMICHMRRNTAFNLPAASAWTKIEIDTTVIDNTGLMADAATNYRITCKRSGKYRVSVQLFIGPIGTYDLQALATIAEINTTGSVLSGTLVAHGQTGGAIISAYAGVVGAQVTTLTAADFIQLDGYQVSATSTTQPLAIAAYDNYLIVEEIITW